MGGCEGVKSSRLLLQTTALRGYIMINDRDIDFMRATTFEASYINMTTSYKIMGPLSETNALDIVYLGMLDIYGRHIEVPCTYVAAELIRLYDSGVVLTLYISPRVEANDAGDYELIPLCIGAVRAV